jgi:hypothetical protein
LHWSGHHDEDLARFVPRTPQWRLAHLPPRLAWEDIQRAINAIDPTTPVGVRDRAAPLFEEAGAALAEYVLLRAVLSNYSEQHDDSLLLNFVGNVVDEKISGTLDMGHYLTAKWTSADHSKLWVYALGRCTY